MRSNHNHVVLQKVLRFFVVVTQRPRYQVVFVRGGMYADVCAWVCVCVFDTLSCKSLERAHIDRAQIC